MEGSKIDLVGYVEPKFNGKPRTKFSLASPFHGFAGFFALEAYMRHPIQPVYKDAFEVIRFRENSIVRHLLEKGGIDLNQIAMLDFPQEDHEQFAQLIGYSVSGFGSLDYASDEVYETAQSMIDGKTEEQGRIEYLTETLDTVKRHMKEIVPVVFSVHPDDLEF